jgi:hypothetical protein
MDISFLQQHCMANHSKILYYLLVVTLLICIQYFLSTYIHFFLLFLVCIGYRDYNYLLLTMS